MGGADYTGPDGVTRTREGLAASVPVTPYEAGEVSAARRTTAEGGDLRLVPCNSSSSSRSSSSAARVFERPGGGPAMDVEEESGVRTRVWPVEGDELELGTPLLIADGHRRSTGWPGEEEAAASNWRGSASSVEEAQAVCGGGTDGGGG